MNRLKIVWRLLNMPCCEMSRLASESLDRELGPLERLALRAHLFYCTACRRYLSQIMLVRNTLRSLAKRVEADEPLPGPGIPDDVRDRIKCAIREEL